MRHTIPGTLHTMPRYDDGEGATLDYQHNAPCTWAEPMHATEHDAHFQGQSFKSVGGQLQNDSYLNFWHVPTNKPTCFFDVPYCIIVPEKTREMTFSPTCRILIKPFVALFPGNVTFLTSSGMSASSRSSMLVRLRVFAMARCTRPANASVSSTWKNNK